MYYRNDPSKYSNLSELTSNRLYSLASLTVPGVVMPLARLDAVSLTLSCVCVCLYMHNCIELGWGG